jgi:hypothetical protein
MRQVEEAKADELYAKATRLATRARQPCRCTISVATSGDHNLAVYTREHRSPYWSCALGEPVHGSTEREHHRLSAIASVRRHRTVAVVARQPDDSPELALATYFRAMACAVRLRGVGLEVKEASSDGSSMDESFRAYGNGRPFYVQRSFAVSLLPRLGPNHRVQIYISLVAGIVFLVILCAYGLSLPKSEQGHASLGSNVAGACTAVALIAVLHYLSLKLPRTFLLSYIGTSTLIALSPASNNVLENVCIVMLIAPLATPVLFTLPWIVSSAFHGTPLHALDPRSREYLQRTGQPTHGTDGRPLWKQ